MGYILKKRLSERINLTVIFCLLAIFPVSAMAYSDANLAANPGFENGTSSPLNWTFVPINGNTPIWSNVSHNGSRSVEINISGTADIQSGYPVSDIITASPFETYTIYVWGKTEGTGGLNTPAVRVVELDTAMNWIRQTNLPVFGRGTNDWEQKKLEFQTSSNTSYLYIYANIWKGFGTFWMDDVELTLNNKSTPTSAPTPSPTPAPTSIPTPPLARAPPVLRTSSSARTSTRPELGVFNRESVPSVNDPLMIWQIIPSPSGLTNYPRIDDVGFNFWSDWSKTTAKWTDQNYIQARFNLADQYKNEYQYAPFLLHEEMFGPIALSTWAEPKSGWKTSGTISFTTSTGIKVDAMLRDTYMASTGKSEQEWEVYYTTIMYKAWNEHMHALGRKSMVIGFLSPQNRNYDGDMKYQMPAYDYVLKNYDAIVDYSYPTSLDRVSYSLDKIKYLDSKYTAPNGKLIWILTSSFGDWSWTWSEAVAQSEFNAVAPYADSIITYPYTNMGSRTNPYPQYLLKFYHAKYG